MKNVRILAAAILVTVVGVLGPLAGAGPAEAAVGDLTCSATIRISFSPPLTAVNTNANVALAATLSSCTSLNGAYSRLSSASVTGAPARRFFFHR